jgi:glycosyltransferase involved in cell wall biosynthesis
MKALVVVLTSYDVDLLERAIKSIENQINVSFSFDTKIVVNTLIKDYSQIVKTKYENIYEVIETKSNGYPGKGHNSVINLFKEREYYTHLIMIDGDDLFYPCAFEQFSKAYEQKIDILHLMLNDYVTFVKKKIRHVPLVGKFNLYSNFDDEQNWWKKIDVKNPLTNSIDLCKTPSRMIFFSRKIFKTDIKIEYDEEVILYDDYVAFLSLCENYFNNKLNIVAISNSYIYCYNALNPDSASRKFKDPTKEGEIFKEKAKKYPLCLKNFGNDTNWNLTSLKYGSLDKPKNYNLEKKKKFCIDKVINWEIENKNKKAKEYYLQKNYDKAEINYSILVNSGASSFDIYFNLGVIYYLKKKYESAIGCFIKANGITPSFDAYKNLFVIYKDLEKNDKQIEYLKKALEIKDDIYLRCFLFNVLPYTEFKQKRIIFLSKQVSLNPYKKPILCYYTGYSDPFNGSNFEDKNVYGSEIAAIKLCEQLASQYSVFIFCACKNEIFYNGVQYYNLKKYDEFQNLYPVDILIVSRFIHFFIEFRCLAKKTYYLLHDARVHNFWKNKSLIDCGNGFFHNIVSNCNKIICVSPWHKQYFCNFVKVPNNYVKIIPNGLDPTNFKVNFTQKKKNRFIYCSDPDRGLIILLQMFPQILSKFPDATLDIYYHKMDNKLLINLINELGDSVRFRGKLKQSELAKELCKSDVWFYPNLYSHETFCLCALEAMAGGNLVITRKYSGLIETIGEGGILIDEHSPEKFKIKAFNIIENMLSNSQKKFLMQKKAIERANKFTWDNISKLWFSLFKQ